MGTGSIRPLWRRAAACAAALAALTLAPALAQDMTNDVLLLVNEQRALRGLAPVTRAAELDLAAARHSNDMATSNIFSHIGSDGSTAGQRITAAGYRWFAYGENIAAGYPTAKEVMDAWMKSPGHRDNILNPTYREIGIAVTRRAGSTYGLYWTQDFAARSGGSTSLPRPPVLPQVTSLSPTTGPAGTRVTVSGSNFGNTPGAVSFNGTMAAIVSWTGNRVVVIVPAGATTGSVSVTTSEGSAAGPAFTVTPSPASPSVFAAAAAPQLISLTPDRGRSGTRVLLAGENLGANQGLSRVIFSPSAGVRVVRWSDTRVTLVIVTPIRGPRKVSVRRSDGRYSNLLTFTVE